LAGSLEGSTSTAMFVCVSQAPANASQTRNSLDFGTEFSKLRMDRLKPMQYQPISKLKIVAEKTLKENQAALQNLTVVHRFIYKRKSLIFDAQQRLGIFSCFDKI